MISYGIWNADLPFADEAGYISDSYGYHANGQFTSNPYKLCYIFIFECFTDDPITAHYICRFATSLCSVILLYYFLKSFSFLKNEYAVLLACVFWAICRLNIPLEQLGNFNLFCITLALPALSLIVRRITINRILFLIVTLLWLASMRPEYFAPLLLFSLFFSIYIYKNRQCLRFENPFALRSVILLIVILFISGCVVFSKKSSISLDKYLLLGLNQCYASLYSKIHSNEKFSPMVEFSSLTDRVFKKPTGFIDACKKNPYEVSKYLILNGTINSVILVPGLIRHRSLIVPVKYGKKGEILQIGIFLAIFISGSMIYFIRNNIRRANIIPLIIRIVSDTRITVLLLLPTASIAALLLLIPDPRYWITFIPILFVWIAWSISNLLDCVNPKKQLFISIPIIIVLSFPVFAGHSSNNRIIYEMRKVSAAGMKPVVGGLYPGGLSFWAFPGGSSIVGVEQLSQDMISGSELDFLFVDKYLRQSMFWDKNRDFMVQFEQSPEKYGYRKLAESTDKHESVVYARIRTR